MSLVWFVLLKKIWVEILTRSKRKKPLSNRWTDRIFTLTVLMFEHGEPTLEAADFCWGWAHLAHRLVPAGARLSTQGVRQQSPVAAGWAWGGARWVPVANQLSYSTGEGKHGQARSRVNTRQAELLLWAELASWKAGASAARAASMSCWPCAVLPRDVGHCWTVRMRLSLQAFGSQVEILQFGWRKKCLINSSALCTRP